MDINAVRAFVAVADAGQFQLAAADLSLTQQAVSKRVAALEEALGVRLFTRTARGAEPTIDGQAFLPHARELLHAADRAAASVQPGRRALRVDVLGRRVSIAGLLRDFHRAHPEIALDIVTLYDDESAVAALRSGTIDVTFRAVTKPGWRLPRDIEAVPVFDEPVELFTGPAHPLGGAAEVTPAELAGHRFWMPGNEPGTEWAAFYDEFAATFGFTVDMIGPQPHFGVEALMDTVTDSTTLGTFLGEHTPLVWPAGYSLRRIPLRDPTPVYPHSLLWRAGNPHPALEVLREHLLARRPAPPDGEVWVPGWVRFRDRGAGTPARRR